MYNILSSDTFGSIGALADRFILAFTRIYEGLFNEILQERVQVFDYIIVLVTFGFVLFFINAKVFSLFGGTFKHRREHRQHDRIVDFIEHVGDEDDDDNDNDNDDLGTIGRR